MKYISDKERTSIALMLAAVCTHHGITLVTEGEDERGSIPTVPDLTAYAPAKLHFNSDPWYLNDKKPKYKPSCDCRRWEQCKLCR